MDGKKSEFLVEEVEVKGKAHAERVHAGAPRDEQTRTDPVAIEIGQTEQAGAEIRCDRDPLAQHGVNRKATQARGKKAIHHGPTQASPAANSPHPTRVRDKTPPAA